MPKTKAKPARERPAKPPIESATPVRAPAPADPGRVVRGTAPYDQIRPSPANPRKSFPEESIRELADSINRAGLQQPLVVRPVPLTADLVGDRWEGLDHFELIDGERRYRALGTLEDVGRVPVTIRWLTDAEALAAAIVANDQREDVRPSEQAAAYSRLAEGRTAEDVAALVGKPVGFVRGLLRLARLPAWALAAVDAGTLSRATAELVARVPGETSRERAAACALLGFETTHELGPDKKAWLAWCEGKTHGGTRVVPNPLSYRQTRALVSNFFQKELKTAVFSKTALYVVDGVERPKCADCPSRAGNDPEAKAEGTRADTCLDPDCYRGKTEEYRRLELERAAKKYGAVPAEPGFNWLFAESPPAGWCDLEALAIDTEIGPELAGNRKSREKLIDLVRWPGFTPGQCQVVAAWGPGGKLRIIAKTTHVRRTLVDGGILPRAEREPRKKPPAKDDGAPETTSAPQTSDRNITRCDKCKATFDAIGRTKCPSCSAALAPPLVSKVSEWEADEKAAEIGAGVLRECAEEQCSQLLDLDDAQGDGSPILGALRLVARTVVYDQWLAGESDSPRHNYLRAAFPGLPADYSGRGSADKVFDPALDRMSAPAVLALLVGLAAAVECEQGPNRQVAKDLLDWAELDWPQLQAQARRVLSGEPSADEKVAAAEAVPGNEPAEGGNPDESADTMDAGLRRALHSFQDADKRWAKLREAGATDAEIKKQISFEFNISGSSGGPGWKFVSYRGGENPAFWYDSMSPAGKPTLSGKPLIDAVRRVMAIPQAAGKEVSP